MTDAPLQKSDLVVASKRWKIADLTSSIGAGVLGAGIGMLSPGYVQGWAIWLLIMGSALHLWGIFDKHRLEAGEPRVWWADALYWACWIILLSILSAVIVVQLLITG